MIFFLFLKTFFLLLHNASFSPALSSSSSESNIYLFNFYNAAFFLCCCVIFSFQFLFTIVSLLGRFFLFHLSLQHKRLFFLSLILVYLFLWFLSIDKSFLWFFCCLPKSWLIRWFIRENDEGVSQKEMEKKNSRTFVSV